MNTAERIAAAYTEAKNYPDLAARLAESGVQSYTVEVSSGTILYRIADGETMVHPGNIQPRSIAAMFNRDQTFQAVKDSQQGKINYPQFMDAIAAAGVRFYEATLEGIKRVNYIGIGGNYEEAIPI